jgi:glycosyltransferase involved in cell wall biosynthesis
MQDDTLTALRMLSIVVPLHNEEESVEPLAAAIAEAMHGWRDDWELILVDDGSRDRTLELAAALPRTEPRIRVVGLSRNYGQSKAMQAGFDHARGDVVVSLDGDLQNDPRDIPLLVGKLDEGYDLVAGYRQRRQDRLLTRRVPSFVANRLIRWLTGVPIRDNGCSLKAYRRSVLERVKLYSDMHRFIPAIAVSVAGATIAEIPVRHHARKYGTSKYGMSRIAKVMADLLTITMIRSYRDRPLVLFGMAGTAALMLSLLPVAAVAATATDLLPDGSIVVLSGIALCVVGLASFLFMLGFIAESLVRAQHEPDPLDRLIVREIVA